ncbi:MAG: Crp/Fnr family transcriptional regulator [Rhodospirillales bacterium]|nr:Crp/Fnr family transcriptional regulator [Rhodospirillales bacterium]
MKAGNAKPPAAERTLAGIALFAPLGESARKAVEQRCRWQTIAAGRPIIDRDSDDTDVYFLVAGRARVVIYSESGREVSFDEIGPGACVGELAAIDGAPRSASVEALAPTLLATLPRQAFLDAVLANAPAQLALLKHLAHMVRHATTRIVELSTQGANNRVYAEILRLAKSAPGTRPAIRPIPAHGEIAARVSTTRETVARVFSDLAKKKIVAREKDQLVVLDPPRLAAMVKDFRPA